MGHFPAGVSIQCILHYAQIITSKKFMLFDWGSALLNKKHYNQDTPPEVNLGNINVPTAMFVGANDDLADATDAKWAYSQIPSMVHYEEVPGGHESFIVGKDYSFFNTVLSLMSKHNPV